LDLDDLDLFSELNIEIIGLENDQPIDILSYIKRIIFFFKHIYSILNNINNSRISNVSIKIRWINFIIYWKRYFIWN